MPNHPPTTPESPMRAKITAAASELTELLPYYYSTDPNNERFLYFRGLLAKAADSLTAIDLLLESVGPIWPLHCRWIIEAIGFASALQDDGSILDQIKRDSAQTYLLIAEVENGERTRILEGISPQELPKIKTLLQRLELSVKADTGLLYKYYRFLCEYAHFEFFRTMAYPALGVEASQDLERTKSVLLNLTVATALSLPLFAHCPPFVGFDDEHSKKIILLSAEAWRTIGENQR